MRLNFKQNKNNSKFDRIRIQAANSIGVGHFSSIIKIKTNPLPPLPPNLECVSTSYNNIKLKWNQITLNNTDLFLDLANPSNIDNKIVYNLQMMHGADHSIDTKLITDDLFTSVYKGTANSFRVNKLEESTNYAFRISAINETAQGTWSNILIFKTDRSPPVITKSNFFFSTFIKFILASLFCHTT